jgi:anti-sigma factor RsiW
MNCRGWTPHIALYVEGDLEAKLAVALEQHLMSCAECAGFLAELRATQRDLLGLKSEAVDEATLNRVRGRVLEQVRVIEGRRTWMDRMAMWLWGGLRWRYAVIGSVALVAIVLGSWRLTHVPPLVAPLPMAVVPVQPAAPLRPVEPVASAAPVLRKAVRLHQPAPRVMLQAANTPPPQAATVQQETSDGKDTLVQILTEDPNVVIYWLIDGSGGF